jgi:3-deoxy-manno-octulosonate cytidylyltransferase (CMP-KDO synthetase)
MSSIICYSASQLLLTFPVTNLVVCRKGTVNTRFPYLLHLGIQCYDAKFLALYANMKPTPLQLQEDLEQLKVLENGYKMKVIKVDHDAHGVDTPEDLAKVEALMQSHHIL